MLKSKSQGGQRVEFGVADAAFDSVGLGFFGEGICFSRLHDAAFDRGLISFDEKLRLIISPRLKNELPLPVIQNNFADYEMQALGVPDDAGLPDTAFLATHRKLIFRAA